MKSKLMRYVIFVLLVLLVSAALFRFIKKKNTVLFHISRTENPSVNPLKGFAAWGENFREDPWVSFAYIPIYWNLLEPEEGVYDFEALEERCYFEEWRKSGVRLIFRLVADSPSDESHMNIPEWLYDKMGQSGTWYDCSYGKGFSPDYRSQVFQEAHARLVKALYERYGQDPQLAFIQLGSLGHWGEWHVNTEAGIDKFPFQAVTDEYVKDYLEFFPGNMLLLRRPYTIGNENHLGLYNDSFGLPSSHDQWLSWIQDGYVSDQNGEALAAMPNFWEFAPSGGEFSPSQEISWYFSEEQFPVTLNLLEESHTTFLGPTAPKFKDFSGSPEEEKILKLLSRMGASLGIRSGRLTGLLLGGDLELTAVWENTGSAPMYQDWPIRLQIRSESGETVWQKDFLAGITAWTPGSHTWSVSLPGTDELPSGSYELLAGITDPLTGEPGLSLTMPGSSYLYEVCRFKVL